MTTYFTTNGRVISDLLASYSNTFLAFLELVNNSIQAKATRIDITIDEYKLEEISPIPTISITIVDNGEGVCFDDVEHKLFDIGTVSKATGKGIGRFAAFQIGKTVSIETVGEKNGKKTKTAFTLNSKTISTSHTKDYPINIDNEPSTSNTYYKVIIQDLYTADEITENPKRKISKQLLLENIHRELFLCYSDLILQSAIHIFVNNREVLTKDFLIEPAEHKTFICKVDGHDITGDLTFIHYISNKQKIRSIYRTENNGIKSQIYTESLSLDLPNDDGWNILVDADVLDATTGLFRNLDTELDEGAKNFKQKTNEEIRRYFMEKFPDYYNFSKKLQKDAYYPYRSQEAPSQAHVITFNQIAYYLENEYKLLRKNIDTRKIIYPLINLAIANGDLRTILSYFTNLNPAIIKKFKELLDTVDLENVIEFSTDIAKKTSFLDFLNTIIYSDISKKVKERSELHKIIENNLWLFGEQYVNTLKLFSDKNLQNNLQELRTAYFSYEPTISDENLIECADAKIKDITDLFFFNENIINDTQREIMIVELKAPCCAIGQKELNQVDRYLYDIEQKGCFAKNLNYKIILVSSELRNFAKSKVGQFDKADKHLYTRSQNANISIYVYQWSDIIAENRRRLSFLGNALKVKDTNIQKFIKEKYPDYGIKKAVLLDE